ncbi:MAG: hypothetical protein ACRDOO_16500 [Actinomadura sp.]
MTRQISFGFGGPSPAVLDQRIRELEIRVATLSEAVRLLAHALEGSPLAEPGEPPVTQAARQAHELMIRDTLVAAARPQGAKAPEGVKA